VSHPGKLLIVNADDYGASQGINRGIRECHEQGIVTSASLMVTGAAVKEAVALSLDLPQLSVGLHWDVWGEDERSFDLTNPAAVRDEFRRQLDAFGGLMERLPTHVDSHRHAHLEPAVLPVIQEITRALDLPLRGTGEVNFIGGFYGQWEWMVTNLDYISVDALSRILREEVGEGWTELGCHPGYRASGFKSAYDMEREVEIQTLTDARVRTLLKERGVSLASYYDLQQLVRPKIP
jgi:predicted glycoside hydrolase/deacetylase ChbG (UPF0249 family)